MCLIVDIKYIHFKVYNYVKHIIDHVVVNIRFTEI